MKFTVAVSALLMASAYGFTPNFVSVRQVSTFTSSASPAKGVGCSFLPTSCSHYRVILPFNSLLEDHGGLQILTLRKEMG
jgi:putative component of membrane protein insertase Oxa1/YidC/SpoIIIJ protein YidD